MKVTGTRPRGRPKMRWLDRLKSDVHIYALTQKWALVENAGRHHIDKMVEDGSRRNPEKACVGVIMNFYG